MNAYSVNFDYGYIECYKDLGVPKSQFYDSEDRVKESAVISYRDNQEKKYCETVLGTTDYSWTSHLCSDRRYIVNDSIGMEKICRTKFPTWGERFIFTRTGTSNDTLRFNLELAYCDVRSFWLPWAPCGMGYGSRSRTSFSIDEVANYNQGGVLKRIAQHQVCVKRISKGELIYAENGGHAWQGKWPLYCAYVNLAFGCNSYLINSLHALIGCVEAPIPDGPGVFNPVKPFGVVAYVDPFVGIEDSIGLNGISVNGLKKRGSKFEKPMIVLTHGLGASDFLELSFDYTQQSYFTNPAENPSCKTFADTRRDNLTYCAKPNPTDITRICACVKGDDCAKDYFVGCAPRPTPEQSGYRIVAEYRDFITDANANPPVSAPAVTPLFVEMTTSGDLIYVNERNQMAYKRDDGKFYLVNSVSKDRTTQEATGVFSKYKTMQMPSPEPIAREFYRRTVTDQENNTRTTYQRDLINIYGVEFAAMIPKTDSSGKPIYKRISSAYAEPEDRQLCNNVTFCEGENCRPGSANHALARDFYDPEGLRDNSLCNSIPIVQASRSCAIGTPPHDQRAINVLCPGVLNEPASGIKICLENFSGWDIISENDSICTSVPMTCEAITEPSAASGFAVWPSMRPGTEMEGECDPAYGLTTTKGIFLTKPLMMNQPPSVSITDFYQYQEMYRRWESIQWNHAVSSERQGVEANSEYIKNFINNFLSTRTGRSQEYYDMFPTVGKHEIKPRRKCTQNSQSEITGSCVKKQGCPAITKPFADSGFATWASSTPFSPLDLASIDRNRGNTIEFFRMSSCSSPYRLTAPLNIPQRHCIVEVGPEPYSATQTPYLSAYWGSVYSPCIKE